MADVNARIVVDMETAQAQAQLRALQSQVAALNKTMGAASLQNMAGQQAIVKQTTTSVTRLDNALAGVSRSAKESFKTASQAIRGSGDAMLLAEKRAQSLNASYKQLGGPAGGLMAYNKQLGEAATKQQVMAQRMVILNRALNQGSTAMLNYGKNLQWAGRQMMVGFTVPLTILGGVAAKTFMDLERQIINFRRVYGDFDTTAADTEVMTKAIEEQAISFAKWGITVRDSIELAASAAATGLTGDDLLNVTEQATKLATLGMITQEQALDTMISLNSAFQIQGQELEDTVNFLNAVENQTVLALSDVTEAIPLVAPVIKGLGGDVKDLAVMLTAMREGGIGANEAANALKTSLARLVTPAKAARDRAEELGINLKALVEDNEGDLMGMIMDLSRAMESLGDLQKQQLLSDLFGKRQFARMGALFSNIADEASQAQRVIDLTASSTAELAALADKELGAIEESTGMRFTKAMEQLKVAIAPIGEAFLKILTPIIEFGTKAANWFNSLEDGAKNLITILVAIGGAVVPVGVMLTGLALNFASFLVKAVAALQGFFAKVQTGATSMEYLNQEQMEAALAADRLSAAERNVTTALNAQAQAVANLGKQYTALAGQRKTPGTPPIKMATGGNVPGAGNTDKIPALLTPGEFVVKKDQANKHRGFLTALNSGNVKGFARGGVVGGPETQKVAARLLEWNIPASEIANAVQKGTTAGMTDQQVAKSLKQDFGPKASYGRFGRGGDPDVQAAHVFPQMQSSAEGVDKAMQELEKGTIKLTEVQETELRNLQQANNILKKQGLPPVGKAALTSNLTYGGEKMMNQAFANTGLSGKETAASLSRTKNFGMDIIKKQMETTGNLSQKQIVGGSKAMQQALEQQAKKLGKNAVVVDDANSKMAQSLKKSGKEVVEFGTLWDRAEKQIAPQHKAFVKEQQALNKQYAQLRIMTTKLTKEQEKALRAAGMQAKNIERAGNNRVALTGAAGASTSRRGNVESKSLLAANMGFDKIASKLRKDGAFAIENYAMGMKDATPKATAQATQTVKAVHTAARKADGQASPSRVWGGIGKNSVMGYINALVAGQKDAQAAGAGLPRAAAQGARSVSPQTMATPGMQGMSGAFTAINAQMRAASQQQVVAQNRFTGVLNVASAAMTKVAASAKTFGQALTKGSMKLSATTGALTGVVFAASMIPGDLQGLAQQIMPATFALMAVQQLLPLLMNPIVAVVAGLVAFVGAMWYVNKAWNDTLKKTKDFNEALVGARKDLEDLADIYSSSSTVAKENARQVAKRTGGEEIDSESLKEAQNTLTTEFGKKLLEQTDNIVKSGGTDAAAEGLANRLTRAVLDGVITTEQARALAQAVGAELDNQELTIEAIGEMNELIGPDGSKIENNEMDIRVKLITDGKDMEQIADQARLLYDSSSLFAKIGAAFSGGGVEDLFAKGAAESAVDSLQQVEEAQADLNQRIKEGSVDLQKLKEDLEGVKSIQEGTTAQEQFNTAQKAFEDREGKPFGSYDDYGDFFQNLSDGVGNMGLGKKVADEIKEGIKLGTSELDKVAGKDGLFGIDALGLDFSETQIADPKKVKEALAIYDDEITRAKAKAENGAYSQENREAAAQRAKDLQKEKDLLIETTMKYYDFAAAINEGKIEGPNEKIGETWADVFNNFTVESEKELNALDEWLKTEFMEGTSIYEKVFGDDANVSEEFKDRLAEATMIAMKNGIAMDDVFKTMGGSLVKTVGYLEDMEYVASEAFDKLPKEDKKKFIYEMATDTGLFNDELLAKLEALPVSQQKKFILEFITTYQTIGRPDSITKEAWGSTGPSYMTNAEQRDAYVGAQLDSMKEESNPADKPTGSTGSSSGGSEPENDWLQDLLEDTKESKELYGKLIDEEKAKSVGKLGWIEWLRRNTDLTEEAIQELAKDEKARQKYANMSKKEREKVDRKSTYNQYRETRDDVRAKEKKQAEDSFVTAQLGNTLVAEQIKKNEELTKLYMMGGKHRERALDLAKRIVDVEMTASEKLKWQNQQLEKQEQLLMKNLQVVKMQSETMAEAAAEAEVLANRTDNLDRRTTQEGMQEENKTYQAEADYIRKSQIGPIEDKIDAQQKIIDGIEREAELLERGLEIYDDQLEAKQKQVEEMRRADELMMRESQMLDHDLKLMGYQEEAINKTYEERIASLDKVAQLNQQIANQQKDQLGVADALRRGDVSAAAAAAQQMQQNQMQFAANQFRSQLETSRDSQIESLTGAESGMTRDQITDRQRSLEESSYQTSLRIRAIEDEIYNIEQLRAGKQAEINDLLATTRQYEDEIFKLEGDILNIEEGRLAEIEEIVAKNEEELAFINWKTLAASEGHRVAIAQETERQAMAKATRDLDVLALEMQESLGQSIEDNIIRMNAFGEAAAAASRAVKTGKYTSKGAKVAARENNAAYYKKALAEFDFNVAPTAKTASFSVPAAAVTSGAVGGIMGNITNNYNNSNVNVMAQGADANQVADIVIQKLELRKNSNIGGQ